MTASVEDVEASMEVFHELPAKIQIVHVARTGALIVPETSKTPTQVRNRTIFGTK